MCLSPNTLISGEQVSCRNCWQCRERRVNDWVGRGIAESKYCDHSMVVTLTYGRDENDNPDHIKAAVLTYSDVQKYFKRMRRDGYKFKYIAVGEYGKRTSRAHWHIALFFKGKAPPDIQYLKNCDQEHWTHGHCYFDYFNVKSARYITKYLLKDETDDSKHYIFRMSKKPPIGSQYFIDEAKRYVEAGLAPQTTAYEFSEAVNKKGRKYQFVMMRKTADIFCQAYVDAWLKKHGKKPMPSSELIEEYLDGLVDHSEREEREFGEKKQSEEIKNEFQNDKYLIHKQAEYDYEAHPAIGPRANPFGAGNTRAKIYEARTEKIRTNKKVP